MDGLIKNNTLVLNNKDKDLIRIVVVYGFRQNPIYYKNTCGLAEKNLSDKKKLSQTGNPFKYSF